MNGLILSLIKDNLFRDIFINLTILHMIKIKGAIGYGTFRITPCIDFNWESRKKL